MMDNYNTARKAQTLDWEGVLTKLWTAFGKPLDPAQFKVYREELSDVPLGVLEHVVGETIKRHKFNSVPTLAELTTVMREFHPDYQVEEYTHTRPHRAEADRRRDQAVTYPRAVDEYREWVSGKVGK